MNIPASLHTAYTQTYSLCISTVDKNNFFFSQLKFADPFCIQTDSSVIQELWGKIAELPSMNFLFPSICRSFLHPKGQKTPFNQIKESKKM